jgi:hypothetical protein
MTFLDKVVAAFFVGLIILSVIPMYLPSARGRVISLYDAGMFAVYLIVLAWGVATIVDGKETMGWTMLFIASGLFGSRMYSVFNRTNANERGG